MTPIPDIQRLADELSSISGMPACVTVSANAGGYTGALFAAHVGDIFSSRCAVADDFNDLITRGIELANERAAEKKNVLAKLQADAAAAGFVLTPKEAA